MQRKRIIKKIKPSIQEGRKEGKRMNIEQKLQTARYNWLPEASKKEIAQAANNILKELRDLSKPEVKQTLKLVKELSLYGEQSLADEKLQEFRDASYELMDYMKDNPMATAIVTSEKAELLYSELGVPVEYTEADNDF